MTAIQVADQIKDKVNAEYSDKPDLFDKLGGSVWTNVEARQWCSDLFTVESNVALVLVVEGIYGWSDWAATNLFYDGWYLKPLTGYALAICA
jgi:hypothetical protein